MIQTKYLGVALENIRFFLQNHIKSGKNTVGNIQTSVMLWKMAVYL
jgi:hypothetical protein